MSKKVRKFYKKYIRGIPDTCTLLFGFVPEKLLDKLSFCDNFSQEINIFLIRLFFFSILIIVNYFYLCFRKDISIEGDNYKITVEYGDLFEMTNCKKVIPFDECFTTKVGDRPCDINEDSICGQYLLKNKLRKKELAFWIKKAKLKPSKSKSQCQNRVRYKSGKIVPRGDDLLLSFAKLDIDGLGVLNKEEYLKCLYLMWHEINKYHGQKDVCVPILGSGVTRMGEKSPTQQELLDMMIATYKLSANKLKKPQKLRIICRKQDDFSLGNIGETF